MTGGTNLATGVASNPRHMSESNEHYTPTEIVEASRAVLGDIDLDPASSVLANATVRARAFWTAEQNGYVTSWAGRVFLNPPGGRSDNLERPVMSKCRETGACGLPVGHAHEGVESSQKKWWFKLQREWLSGRVDAAIFVCFSIELFQVTQCDTPAGADLPLDFPVCFPKKRIAYVAAKGGALSVGASPPHSSAIILVCASHDRVRRIQFSRTFGRIGAVRDLREIEPEPSFHGGAT